MSILSDTQIKELCAEEAFDIFERIKLPGSPEIYEATPINRRLFVSREEMRAKVEAGWKGLISFSDASHLLPKPMIEPFVPHQVREKWREPTKEELRIWNMNHDPIPGSDWVKPDNWRSIDIDVGLEIGEKIVSYGLSSYGYDVRIADEFKIFTNAMSTVINPKAFDEKSFVDFKGPVCIIPPNSFVLARSVEYFRMPVDVTGVVLGKSTYARCGINCIATPLECGWEGHITLEYANTTPLPAMLFANEGAAQVLFFKGDVPAEVNYAMRNGKYQGQTGITLPKT